MMTTSLNGAQCKFVDNQGKMGGCAEWQTWWGLDVCEQNKIEKFTRANGLTKVM